jgi:regulator of protease activity HflC (stomatin/prohibitin superfamily)
MVGLYIAILLVLIIFFWEIRIIRPTHRGLVERLGKYNKFGEAGFHWIIPIIDRMIIINISSAMPNCSEN